ncbi:MAG TPA: hypothetical protein VEC57_08550 [Candidatus Limnocylindrales bacterium]|nr:hypothetical protein [Candidatus Limnocylindrales bacterium]
MKLMSTIVTPCCAAMLSAAMAISPGQAPAQDAPSDHLKCYRINDTNMFKKAHADLQAQSEKYGLHNCRIARKAGRWCVPVRKTVTDLEDGTPIELDGEDQTMGRLCYRVFCPDEDIAPTVVTDQFGTRSVRVLSEKPTRLCTPAIEGLPTTTTTTQPSPTTTTAPTTTTLPDTTTTLPDTTTTVPAPTTTQQPATTTTVP